MCIGDSGEARRAGARPQGALDLGVTPPGGRPGSGLPRTLHSWTLVARLSEGTLLRSWRAGRLIRGSWSFPRTWATRAVLRARRIMADPGWQALFWWRMRWLDQPLRVRYTHLLVSTATLVERAPRTPRSRLLSRRGRRRTYRIATRPSRQALNTRSTSEETQGETFATVYVRAMGCRS